MSQDKSREFLHSGNDKDKFKVFAVNWFKLMSTIFNFFFFFFWLKVSVL